jgi:hypothetical protein
MKKFVSESVWLRRVRWHVQHWQFQLWVICVCLCRDSTDFFSDYLSPRAIYVWLCRDFDFHSAENRPTFRRIQPGLLCRARSNIFIRVLSYYIKQCKSKATDIPLNYENNLGSISCFFFSMPCQSDCSFHQANWKMILIIKSDKRVDKHNIRYHNLACCFHYIYIFV